MLLSENMKMARYICGYISWYFMIFHHIRVTWATAIHPGDYYLMLFSDTFSLANGSCLIYKHRDDESRPSGAHWPELRIPKLNNRSISPNVPRLFFFQHRYSWSFLKWGCTLHFFHRICQPSSRLGRPPAAKPLRSRSPKGRWGSWKMIPWVFWTFPLEKWMHLWSILTISCFFFFSDDEFPASQKWGVSVANCWITTW